MNSLEDVNLCLQFNISNYFQLVSYRSTGTGKDVLLCCGWKEYILRTFLQNSVDLRFALFKMSDMDEKLKALLLKTHQEFADIRYSVYR